MPRDQGIYCALHTRMPIHAHSSTEAAFSLSPGYMCHFNPKGTVKTITMEAFLSHYLILPWTQLERSPHL